MVKNMRYWPLSTVISLLMAGSMPATILYFGPMHCKVVNIFRHAYCVSFPYIYINFFEVLKKILLAVTVLIIIGVCTGIYLWFKPHEKVENKKGVVITAVALAQEYGANEQQADTKYLNKALEVSGKVSSIEKNQDGGLAITLDTGDPMAGVQCTMRDRNVQINKDQDVTIKGFCSGHSILGVSLTDCVVKK
jgi:hypothetical protein